MKLILVRHPETEANYHKLYIGQTESQYTDKGKAQVEKILNEIDYTVDVIYTSPMSRCKLLSEEINQKILILLKHLIYFFHIDNFTSSKAK